MMLALGAAFLSHTTEYSPQIFALLFGEVLGVSTTEILPVAVLAVVVPGGDRRSCTDRSSSPRPCPRSPSREAYRHPPDGDDLLRRPGAGDGHDRAGRRGLADLQPDGRAGGRGTNAHSAPAVAIALSTLIALLTVWAAIACSYWTNWPIGFFVGVFSAFVYGLGRVYAH